MLTKLKQTFIGRPLKSLAEGEGGLLGKMQALAMLSSDALSSIAYGPEQVVLVLASLSPLAIWWSLPIGLFVLLLLASLTVSYRQIIHAYPQGGGAYMVTRENLSPELGLIAGGSLLVDYMLTVAVSVSSGADAITAALPALHPYNLHISIFLVCLLMLLNLRGLKESASSLMIPVYLFIISTVFLLLYGIFQLVTGFQGSERKECCSDLDHHGLDFRFSFCRHYLPKLLDGDYASTRRNYSFTDGSRHPW